jgi:hypothetical protein
MRMSPLAQKLPISGVSTPESADSRRLTAWCAPDNPWQGRHFEKHAMLGQALDIAATFYPLRHLCLCATLSLNGIAPCFYRARKTLFVERIREQRGHSAP